MGDNIIYNNNDETIGYYNDLYKMYTDEITNSLKAHDIETAQSMLEELEELSELCNYDGLIILSENNGMGFTARKYEGEK